MFAPESLCPCPSSPTPALKPETAGNPGSLDFQICAPSSQLLSPVPVTPQCPPAVSPRPRPSHSVTTWIQELAVVQPCDNSQATHTDASQDHVDFTLTDGGSHPTRTLTTCTRTTCTRVTHVHTPQHTSHVYTRHTHTTRTHAHAHTTHTRTYTHTKRRRAWHTPHGNTRKLSLVLCHISHQMHVLPPHHAHTPSHTHHTYTHTLHYSYVHMQNTSLHKH